MFSYPLDSLIILTVDLKQ